MTILTPANAFPGMPFPNKTSGQSKPQNYTYPGAARPRTASTTVLTYANAFPNMPFPQHGAGLSSVFNYLYPGAVQPQPPILMPQAIIQM